MITVKEVKTRRDLKKFIDFPVKLYKDNPYFCPTLAIDEMMNLDPKKIQLMNIVRHVCF